MAKSKSDAEGFSAQERAAMKERARELRSARGRGKGAKKAEADEQDCLTKIGEMPEADRTIAETLHAIVGDVAPDLAPKTWYGMPAYARDGKVLVFFKGAAKFDTRYAEVGFNEVARLDAGDMWATAYAVTTVTPAVETKLRSLVRKAAG